MKFSKFTVSALAILSLNSAVASTTRVGNGDDGGDLEGAKPITSGIIFETRGLAAARLKALNIQGVAGLGFVIPEIENTQLLMAQHDVRPLSSEGDFEASEARDQAYARTFPEPHAPTRFFPAAAKLNREQLIALHTHEALHRALPPHVREDEEKVALLTMALTSPSATFDRVNRIAANILAEPKTGTAVAGSSSGAIPLPPLPSPRRTTMYVEHINYFASNGGISVEKVGSEFSPFGTMRVFGLVVDPRLSGELFLVSDGYGGMYAGPMSLEARLPTVIDAGNTFTPFTRVTLRSLEEGYSYFTSGDRDVYAIGAELEHQRPDNYSTYGMSYTLPDHFNSEKGTPAIWSFDMRLGAKIRRFDLGGTVGAYHMLAKGNRLSFTLVSAGPEIRYVTNRMSIKLGAATVLNRRSLRQLGELNDLAGHGAGTSQLSLGISFNL